MAETGQIFNVVLGTAGHIDHGKSTLVQALTGVHPDRLKEEQERGITIDLGFAPLQLSSGLRVGIIDVPGHERFIKNMVAGATGVDFVMLVVAADDGVMAQTREHLQILQLLCVRDGLTVITKKDLVEPDYLELAVEDVKALEAGTFLDGKPILTVSCKTGEGISELKATLEAALSRVARRAVSGPFRMPIQRVFAKEGFGTVVTGVPLSGQVAIGDTLQVLPPGYEGRVKVLHAYGRPIARGQAGHSTAINLHGARIDKQQVGRGMVAVTPGVFRPCKLVTARLVHLPGLPRPLKHRAPVRFHSGTVEVQGKVLLLEGEQMASGATGWIQVLLAEPTVLVPGDRFILRHQTPMITLGGGEVLDVAPRKRKRAPHPSLSPEGRGWGEGAELQRRLECLNDSAAFVAHILAAAEGPKTLEELCSEAGLLPQQILGSVKALIQKGAVTALQPDAVFISCERLEELLRKVLACINDHFAEHPALGNVERPELRRRVQLSLGAVSAAYFDDLVAVLKLRNKIRAESNWVALPGRERHLEGSLALQARQVELAFAAGGLAPPHPAEIEAQLKIQARTYKEILKFLLDTGRLVQATPEVIFHCESFEKALADTRALFAQKAELTTSEIRQRLGMNRKHVVPLVELFDQRGVTVRVADMRRLKSP